MVDSTNVVELDDISLDDVFKPWDPEYERQSANCTSETLLYY